MAQNFTQVRFTVLLAKVLDGTGGDSWKTWFSHHIGQESDEVSKSSFNPSRRVIDVCFPNLGGIHPDLLSIILSQNVEQHQILDVELYVDMLSIFGMFQLSVSDTLCDLKHLT